jgi:flagellar motility protein MotE (MotC chaperone)
VLLLAPLGLGLAGVLHHFSLSASGADTATAGEKAPAPRQVATPNNGEQLLMLSTGDIPLLQSLQERQAHLDTRAKQLDKREEELHFVQQQVEEKLSMLTTLRKEVGALLEEKEAFEEKRFEHLVKVYEGMKPEEAASLIERLNEDTAIKLFYRMKEKKVAQILGLVKPEVAAKLSERLAVQRQGSKNHQKAPEKGQL